MHSLDCLSAIRFHMYSLIKPYATESNRFTFTRNEGILFLGTPVLLLPLIVCSRILECFEEENNTHKELLLGLLEN